MIHIYGNVMMKTHCIAIFNKQNVFFQSGEQEGKTGPVYGWYQ
jgi:hypothetical protein